MAGEATSRVIVLTGATRGLGRALTARFAELGHQVIGCGSNARLVEELRGEFGSPHDFSVVDVTDEGVVRDWATRVIAEFGPPDLLLNNAALINRNARLWEVPPEEFSRIVDVNVKGVFHVLRHFVPAMVEAKRGVIVNFSSAWGRATSPEVAPYNATKFAIEGMTQALAQELPAPLAAIPLNPGIIDTEMLRSCFGAGASRYPDADRWSKTAAKFLLGLGRVDNGRSLSVPSA